MANNEFCILQTLELARALDTITTVLESYREGLYRREQLPQDVIEVKHAWGQAMAALAELLSCGLDLRLSPVVISLDEHIKGLTPRTIDDFEVDTALPTDIQFLLASEIPSTLKQRARA